MLLQNRRLKEEREIAEQISQEPVSGKDLIQEESAGAGLEKEIEQVDFGKLSKLEISQKTASCLKEMKDEQGIYAFAKECSTKNNCQLLSANNQIPRLIWLWYQLYLETGDEDYISKINQDLDNCLNNVSTIQNDAWNCRLIYPIFQSQIFSSETNVKLKKVCVDSVQLPPLESQYVYLVAETPSLYKFRLDLKRQNKAVINSRIKTKIALQKLAYLSSDYLYEYYFTNQNSDLVFAKATFNQALNKYLVNKIENRVEYGGETCLLGQAALDFYLETEDQKYLDYASYFWQNRQTEKFSGKVTCAFFADQLFNELGKAQYKNERERLLEDLVQKHFDNRNYKSYFTGDGCFNIDSQRGVLKFTTENCLINGLLLKD